MSGWIQGWIAGCMVSWRCESIDVVMDGWADEDMGETQYVGPRLDGYTRE